MPERSPSEIPANAERPASAFEAETGAYFRVGNPDLIPYEEVTATNEAKLFAESNQPKTEQPPTPQKEAGIITLYVMHLRRNLQNEQNRPNATLSN